MGHLQIEKLRAAKLETDPFEYVVVPAFLNAASLKRINTTFPAIAKGGSYPIGYHPAMSKKKRGSGGIQARLPQKTPRLTVNGACGGDRCHIPLAGP
jgi:hypothetical protein